MDTETVVFGDGSKFNLISRDIDLEGMSFTFNGQSVPGERLADLLGLTSKNGDDEPDNEPRLRLILTGTNAGVVP